MPSRRAMLEAALIGALLGTIASLLIIGQIERRRSAPAVAACQADCKSGCGCCRPHLQEDGSWKVECDNTDWRKP